LFDCLIDCGYLLTAAYKRWFPFVCMFSIHSVTLSNKYRCTATGRCDMRTSPAITDYRCISIIFGWYPD